LYDLGTAIIVMSGLYIILGEHRLKKQKQVTPNANVVMVRATPE
jgi:hypothetical protein